MKFYPAEIISKTFDRKMMGFDTEQVTQFLALVAAQMETLMQERNLLIEELKKKELELHGLKDQEQAFKTTMTQTSQMTERIRNEAEREAKLIVLDAQKKGELIVQDAQESLKKIYAEMAQIKKSKMQFEANLRAMAQAHLSLLDQTENYMPKMRMPHLDLE